MGFSGRFRPGRRFALVALAVATLAALAATETALRARAAPVDAAITLDPAQKHQVMTGWEATANLIDTITPEGTRNQTDEARMAVTEAGINRVRLEITAGAENRSGKMRDFIAGRIGYDRYKPFRYRIENDNGDPFVIDPAGFDFAELDWHVENTVLPMRELLAERGERLVINLCYVAFGNGRTIHMQPEEYAELMQATFRHLRDSYGIVPDLIEVMLEPDLDRGWTGRDMGLAMVATQHRLAADGFHPGFVVPSVTDMSHTLPFLDAILDVDGTAPLIREVSYHRYKGANPATLGAIAEAAARIGAQTAMLEWWFGKATYKVLLEDLAIGNNAAWQGRSIDSLVERGDDGALRLRPDVALNARYFRNIPVGSRRIGAQSSDPQVTPLAFVTPKGGTVIVLTASRAGQAVLHDMPPGPYRITGTFKDGTPWPGLAGLASAGGSLVLRLPGAGVFAVTPE